MTITLGAICTDVIRQYEIKMTIKMILQENVRRPVNEISRIKKPECECEDEGRAVECDDDTIYCTICKKKVKNW